MNDLNKEFVNLEEPIDTEVQLIQIPTTNNSFKYKCLFRCGSIFVVFVIIFIGLYFVINH
jgi:hypothetical protein